MTRDRHAPQRGISMILVVVVLVITILLTGFAVAQYIHLQHLQGVQKELKEIRNAEEKRADNLIKLIDEEIQPTGLTRNDADFGTASDPELKKRAADVLAPQPQKLLLISENVRSNMENRERAQFALAQKEIYSTLQSLVAVAAARLAYIKNLNDSLKLQLADARIHAEAVAALKEPMTQGAAKYRADVTAMIAELNKKIQDAETAYNQREQALRTDFEAAKAAIEQEDQNFASWERDNRNKRNKLQDELERLKVLEAINVDIRTVHGRILRPDVANKVAFIDIGSRDRVVPGIAFAAVKRGDQDRFVEKGWLKVKKVWPTYSEVLITNLADPHTPVVEGDLIINPFFNTRRPMVVAFAGRPTPIIIRPTWDIPETTRRVVELGSEVRETVGLDVDFLVFTEVEPAKQMTSYPNFVRAATLGIPYMKASDVYRYLGE